MNGFESESSSRRNSFNSNSRRNSIDSSSGDDIGHAGNRRQSWSEFLWSFVPSGLPDSGGSPNDNPQQRFETFQQLVDELKTLHHHYHAEEQVLLAMQQYLSAMRREVLNATEDENSSMWQNILQNPIDAQELAAIPDIAEAEQDLDDRIKYLNKGLKYMQTKIKNVEQLIEPELGSDNGQQFQILQEGLDKLKQGIPERRQRLQTMRNGLSIRHNLGQLSRFGLPVIHEDP